jgi:hypothetical protein
LTTDDRVEKKAHLTGRHDVDQGWLKDVRTVAENGTAPLIVPRFMFQGWLLEDYQFLFAEQALINQLIALLVRECVYALYFIYLFNNNSFFSLGPRISMAWCWSITSSSTPRSRRSSLAWPTNCTSSTRRSFSSSRYLSSLLPFPFSLFRGRISHFQNISLILLQSDKGAQHALTSAVFVWLAEYIDGFSLMTYDYSTSLRYLTL